MPPLPNYKTTPTQQLNDQKNEKKRWTARLLNLFLVELCCVQCLEECCHDIDV